MNDTNLILNGIKIEKRDEEEKERERERKRQTVIESRKCQLKYTCETKASTMVAARECESKTGCMLSY